MASSFLGRKIPQSIAPGLKFGPEADAAGALARLRASKIDAPLEVGRRIVSGVWIDADPEARARGRVRTGAAADGALLDVEVDIKVPAGWLTMHVDFGGRDLSGAALLGVALRAEATEAVTLRPCLRSGLGTRDGPDGFADAFLPKTAVAPPEAMLHLDALDLTSEARAPLRAPWRQFMLFLDARPQRLRILDMRIFAV